MSNAVVIVKLDPDIRVALGEFIARMDGDLSASEAVRVILGNALRVPGYWLEAKEAPSGRRAK